MGISVKTIDHETKLHVLECGVCGIPHAIPDTMYRNCMADGGSWHCPNGHTLVFTTTDADKLRAKLEKKERLISYQEERIEEWKRSAAAYKGQKTKLLNRVKNGVCPCCNRSFKNLHSHIQNKHPELFENG